MSQLYKFLAILLAWALVIGPVPILAAPKGGVVVKGNATIRQVKNTTFIKQTTPKTIINWKSFDIGKNERVQHQMPNAASSSLYRVVGGGGASQIAGTLQSNGNVYLSNPAGVNIEKGARILTNSFVATSRDIANDNFLKDRMVFDKPGRANASVVNKGTISVSDNGLAALVAPTVRNDGVIAGNLAKVALASGHSTYTLDMHGDKLVTFSVSDTDVNNMYAADGTPLSKNEAKNTGKIKANGGLVVLSAAHLDGVVGGVVNTGGIEAGEVRFSGRGSKVSVTNSGSIKVQNTEKHGGKIIMDTEENLSVSGALNASGKKGGTVALTGTNVVVESKTTIDASGNTGGGTIHVGGNAKGKGTLRNAKTTTVKKKASMTADAKERGDGGKVVVWSDEKTVFNGRITARGGKKSGNGGFVETSGAKLTVGDDAWVSTVARNLEGKVGEWLLDPNDLIIGKDGGLTGAKLSEGLKNGSIKIVTNNDNGSVNGNGDIIFKEDIDWENAKNFLTLDAERNVDFGNINLDGARVKLSDNVKKVYINSSEYTILRKISELQNIDGSGNYVLSKNINAKSIENFTPISLYGNFNGLGNSISNLTVNNSYYDDIGLFSRVDYNSVVSNLNVIDANITGYVAGIICGENYGVIKNITASGSVAGSNHAGGIAGWNYGEILNTSVSGTVDGNFHVGGLVGHNRGKSWSDSYIGKIDGAKSTTDVTGTLEEYTHALVGWNQGGEITNSSGTGKVNGKYKPQKFDDKSDSSGQGYDSEENSEKENDGENTTPPNIPPIDTTPNSTKEVSYTTATDKEVKPVSNTVVSSNILYRVDAGNKEFLTNVVDDVVISGVSAESVEESNAVTGDSEFMQVASASEESASGKDVKAPKGTGKKLDRGTRYLAMNTGVARSYSKKAKMRLDEAKKVLNEDFKRMSPEKRIAVLSYVGQSMVYMVAAKALSSKGANASGVQASTVGKEGSKAVVGVRGAKERSRARGQRWKGQEEVSVENQTSTVRLGQSESDSFSVFVEAAMADVPTGAGKKFMQTLNLNGEGRPVVDTGAQKAAVGSDKGVGVDPRVSTAINTALLDVVSAIDKTGKEMGDDDGSFVRRSSGSVMEKIKNDEKLQRYIDLFDHYMKNRISAASAIMG